MSTPANFNGSRPVIDVNDTAMLLIDHQSGLFQTVGDMPMPELRARAAALAKMASLAGIPVITTASVPQGPNGPLIPEIHKNAPHAHYIARKGEINAWDNPEFVAAVKATGRKTLIIAGTITSVCMAFPAIAAVADGYRVFAVIDASGTYSKMAQEITLARVDFSINLGPFCGVWSLPNCSAHGIDQTPQNGPRFILKSSRHTSC